MCVNGAVLERRRCIRVPGSLRPADPPVGPAGRSLPRRREAGAAAWDGGHPRPVQISTDFGASFIFLLAFPGRMWYICSGAIGGGVWVLRWAGITAWEGFGGWYKGGRRRGTSTGRLAGWAAAAGPGRKGRLPFSHGIWMRTWSASGPLWPGRTGLPGRRKPTTGTSGCSSSGS